jgi:hypothetical protein
MRRVRTPHSIRHRHRDLTSRRQGYPRLGMNRRPGLSAVEVSRPTAAVRLGSELPLKLGEALDLGAVDADVGGGCCPFATRGLVVAADAERRGSICPASGSRDPRMSAGSRFAFPCLHPAGPTSEPTTKDRHSLS